MKIIHLDHPPAVEINGDGKVLALGFFDGVHIGHQKVIETAIKAAREKELEAAVMGLLSPRQGDVLTPPEDMADLLAALGADTFYVVHSDFGRLSHQSLIEQYVSKLNIKEMVVGFGDMPTDVDQLSGGKFPVTIVPAVTLNGVTVTSKRIRALIHQGAMSAAEELLGHSYRMKGQVVHGDKRGGEVLGFPTANIEISAPYVYPGSGIYAVQMKTKTGVYDGVGYIGSRPTFYEHDQIVTMEIHLFDFDQDVYGESVSVDWCLKLRDDIKFTNVPDLIDQMKHDVARARDYFKGRKALANPANPCQ
ncbi:riboflavin biosynthesis protein RibF [Camelliibacillus cellulosilyticus]|uniref:Riboflavin biosynthesis protein n=1 Tax=Camelliibacillus cellulosilyticus TaxID=2174486 RepID=A0ABV9GJU2_9BACL